MMASRKSARKLGRHGEQAAKEFLVCQGYSIRETNWHCPRGELDIVAEWEDTLVFVEVKTRQNSKDAWDSVIESFTPRKRERLLASIYHYLNDADLEESNWRLDIIAVFWREGIAPILKHLESVLDWE